MEELCGLKYEDIVSPKQWIESVQAGKHRSLRS